MMLIVILYSFKEYLNFKYRVEKLTICHNHNQKAEKDEMQLLKSRQMIF